MNPLLKRLYDLAPPAVQNALVSAFSARLERQRYGGRFKEFAALLEESQWWDARRMGEWQDERLRAIVRHAYEHMPYYRELFDRHGIDAVKFRGREDLARIPVLTRDTIKAPHRGPEVAPPRGPLARRRPHQRHHGFAAVGVLQRRHDHDELRGHGPPVSLGQRKARARWRPRRGRARQCHRAAHAEARAVLAPQPQSQPAADVELPSFADEPRQLLRRAARVQAEHHRRLSLLALRAREGAAQPGERLPLKAAITSSETLYDFQREAIESAFQCRVFDYYAAAERVIFTVECDKHEGHHLCEEYGITEIVDDDRQPLAAGNEGLMVGTSLHNIGMPMIRYLTTDRTAVKTKSCSCGRPLPLMEDVTTKAEDLLRLSDGRLIPPSVLTHPFKPLDSIEASQLVQTDLDRLLVRLIPRPEYSPNGCAST